MKRSVSKILTTPVGSLPFLALDKGIAAGDAAHLSDDVVAVVKRQRDIGIDLPRYQAANAKNRTLYESLEIGRAHV